MEVIQNKWLENFFQELDNTKVLRIISPFIKETMVNHLLSNWKGDKIHVITRYNLNDFRSRVSSLSALEKLTKSGVEIKGIKDLHSKAYIFDTKSMIITSANFTNGGFFTNYELGIKSNDFEKVNDAICYFDKLWSVDDEILTLKKITEWSKIISSKPIIQSSVNLPDMGKSMLKKVIGNKNYFIKFYGNSDDRANWNESVDDLIEGTHCHFAITFPDFGRPIRYNDGDIVYMARMIEGGEYAIFGKAIARKHDRKRDVASKEDKKLISWKNKYPIYIRVHSVEFLDTTFQYCPKMGVLMDQLGPECFKSTKERFEAGENDINPRLSLMRKPDIWLSEEGAYWVEQKFQEAKKIYKLVPQIFIDSLYQGNPKI